MLTRGDSAAADPAYRLFDEHGNVLVLRLGHDDPDRARGGDALPDAPIPLRFSYVAHAYRAVKQHRGHPREILQAGIELVGAPGPEGTAEAVTVLCATLDAAGLDSYRVGLGDASLFPRALDQRRRARHRADPARARLARHGRARARAARGRRASSCSTSPGRAAASRSCPRASRCARLYALLAPDVAERVIFDLGLVRTLGYYTGPVFEVYDAAFGSPLGGGGRYDDLLGPLRAVAAGVRAGRWTSSACTRRALGEGR